MGGYQNESYRNPVEQYGRDPSGLEQG